MASKIGVMPGSIKILLVSYHINFLSFYLLIIFGLAEKLKQKEENLMISCPRACKWSSLEPHSLSIALLDWTIKQKRGIYQPLLTSAMKLRPEK